MLMATRLAIDFHAVEAKHSEIHKRLENWARWCNGREAPSVSPMFRLYRAPARARGAEHTWSGVSVDGMDAQRIAKAVTHLPEPHRRAIHWSYIKPISPKRAAAEQGTTLPGLALLLRDARQMLLNRQA
jgi:DNA-directed RNA polymerase specialized sigma24 family protein